MPLVHHELCFGCGRTNVFGLLLELAEVEPGQVAGRCFIKQDHQGADRGSAHDGVVAAAVTEAMSLACGESMRALSLELTIEGRVAVGTFLAVEARVTEATDAGCHASATATADHALVASARGRYARLT